MPRFVLTPFGSAGDVLPFIWIGKQLLARGHEVTLVTSGRFAKPVRAAGLEFVEFGTAEEFDRIERDPRLWHPLKASIFAFRMAAHTIDAMRDVLMAEHARAPIAAVLGSVLAAGGRLFREQTGVPCLTVHLQPCVLLSADDPPVMMNGVDWFTRLPRWLIRLAFRLPNPVEYVIGSAARAACKRAGVAGPQKFFPHWCHSPDGVLLLWPEWFAAPQRDWPAGWHQVGFPLEDLAGEVPLSSALLEFLAAGAKPVVFTPGSANVQARDFFRSALEAVLRVGCRAVFVTRDLSQLPPDLPSAQVHAAEYVPFSPLLRQAACFVHHGGIGTLSQGFAAGVPQLLMPMAHDQPDHAYRLRRLGAGLSLPPARFTPDNVTAALRQCLTDPAMAAAAKACQGRIALDQANAQRGAELCGWIEQRANAVPSARSGTRPGCGSLPTASGLPRV